MTRRVMPNVNKIVLRDEHLDATRNGIGPHPAEILILQQGLDAAAFQDGFKQIHSLVTVMTMISNSFTLLQFSSTEREIENTVTSVTRNIINLRWR